MVIVAWVPLCRRQQAKHHGSELPRGNLFTTFAGEPSNIERPRTGSGRPYGGLVLVDERPWRRLQQRQYALHYNQKHAAARRRLEATQTVGNVTW